MSAIKNVTYENFSDLLKKSEEKNLILYFSASWCGPCRMSKYMIEDFAKKYEKNITFGKVDVDDYRVIAQEYGINSIPAFVLIKDKEEVDRFGLNALSFKIDHIK